MRRSHVSALAVLVRRKLLKHRPGAIAVFTATCTEGTCTLKWKTIILDISQTQFLFVELSTGRESQTHQPHKQIRGPIRSELARKALEMVSSKLKYKLLSEVEPGSHTNLKYLIPSKRNLRKMVHEHRERAKFNKNPRVNLIELAEHMKERDTHSQKITGFVQSMDCLNEVYFMTTEMQVKAFINVAPETLHLDATGGIITGKNKGRKYFLYSLVFKGEDIPPLPLSCSLSAQHRASDIQEFIKRTRTHIKRVAKKEHKPKIIVTDFSMANIAAITDAYDLGTVREYINDSYENPHKIETEIKLCCAHVMKAFATKTKEHITGKEERKLVNTVCYVATIQIQT